MERVNQAEMKREDEVAAFCSELIIVFFVWLVEARFSMIQATSSRIVTMKRVTVTTQFIIADGAAFPIRSPLDVETSILNATIHFLSNKWDVIGKTMRKSNKIFV